MNVVFYVILAICFYFLGKIDKPVRVAGVSLALPLCILIGIGIIVTALVLFNMALIITAFIILLVVKKFKIIIGVKIAAFLTATAAALLGVFAGPPGWLMTIISIIIIAAVLDSLKDMAIKTYKWIFSKLAEILFYIRRKADGARSRCPSALQFIVLIIEVPLVCGLSANGLWELMNWFDKTTIITSSIIIFRAIVIIPFVVILYRAYIRDTTPPNNGTFDLPGKDLPSIATSMINH